MKKLKLSIEILFLILTLTFVNGCKKSEKTENLAVEQKIPQRIICLSPASAEICFAVGAGDKVVACSEFCDYPEEVKNVPVVGGFDGKTLSLEKILSFKPDFVYLTSGMHDFLISVLEENGINYYVSVADSVDSVMKEISDIGKITGNENKAQEINAGIENIIDSVKGVAEMCSAEGVAEKPTAQRGLWSEGEASPTLENKKIYWEVWNAPYMSAGRKSFINDVIVVSGGKNIFDDLDEAYPIVSEESLIARAPDIILIPASSALTVDSVKGRIGWQNIPAVKNDKIFILDDNLYTRPGPRIGLVIKELSEIIGG